MSNNISDNLILAEKIARDVSLAGGRAYFVGGCVRDKLMGKAFSDIDIEVHGLTAQTLEQILECYGSVKTVGKSFGIFTLRSTCLDVALPRKERCIGQGHRDFSIDVDPFIGTREAARRRDFTICAMMEDVLSGEIIDHFGGKEDLQNRILRHVDDEKFSEDALRVLRGGQFAARFDLTVADETKKLCASIDLSQLPKERVLEETRKALLSPHPSVFFEFLREIGQLQVWFKELVTLIGVDQNPKYHAEGDVWNHTMLVLDEAAKLRSKASQPFYFMMAAVCHDFGKPLTTETVDGRIRSYGHEQAGLTPAKAFLSRLSNEAELHRYVLNMIKLHMRPHQLASQNSSPKATAKLFDAAVCPEDLCLLASADNLGRRPVSDTDHTPFLEQRLAHYRDLMARPQVTGKDLIDAGLTPDKHFHKLLEQAHKLHLAGVDKATVLKQLLP